MANRLTKAEAFVLAVARRDGGILCEHTIGGTVWVTFSGESLPRKGVDGLLAKRVLVGDQDGLLEGVSQVYRVAIGERA